VDQELVSASYRDLSYANFHCDLADHAEKFHALIGRELVGLSCCRVEGGELIPDRPIQVLVKEPEPLEQVEVVFGTLPQQRHVTFANDETNAEGVDSYFSEHEQEERKDQ